MKKFFTALFITLTLLLPIGSFVKVNADAEISTTCKSAVLMDYNSGTIIYSNKENERHPIASMCKIITLNIIFDEINNGNLTLDDDITVSERASGMGGSQAFLEKGGIYKLKDLVKSIVISSANDSCVAIAEKISGSEEAFVSRMNANANKLGLKNTLFSNCTGLPKPTQYSCAKDVALMFKNLINNKDYFMFSKIWLDKIQHKGGRETELANTNKLIRFYEGCDGGKTGYTSEAGHCIAASAMRGGTRLISVVIGAKDSATRFAETKSMFNYGFANYCNRLIIDDKKPQDIKIKVKGGKEDFIDVIAEKPIFRFTKRNEKENIEIDYEIPDCVKAPIKSGDLVGKISVYKDGLLVDEVNLLSCSDVKAKNIGDIIEDITENWKI